MADIADALLATLPPVDPSGYNAPSMLAEMLLELP